MLGLTGCSANMGAASDAGMLSGSIFGSRTAESSQTDDTGKTGTAKNPDGEDSKTGSSLDSDGENSKAGSSADSDGGNSKTGSSAEKKLDVEEMFTDRDLAQTADLSEAQTITVTDGKDVHITKAGVYVLTGTASEATVYVEAGDEDKVQLVLDGVSMTNQDFPCIYVKSGDKVFVTTTDTENSLSVTGAFAADGSTKTDGVIFSKSDLVLNGTGTLAIQSSDQGVVCKDDLKVTGGTWKVTAASKAFDANDSIRIADGTFEISAGTDGLHAENKDDPSKGYIYIGGGTFDIQAGDDGVHAVSVIEVDGGTFDIAAGEGMEATVVQLNDGAVSIQASDDGINAANKSSAYSPLVEINGGQISVVMGAGDTDGIDSNGDVIVNGGTIDVTGNSSFDYDGTAQFNGGTITVNGEQVDTIPNQIMGGGMRGGMRGGMNGGMGGFGKDFNGSADSNGNTDNSGNGSAYRGGKDQMGRPERDFNGNAGNNGNTDNGGDGSVDSGRDFNGSMDNSGDGSADGGRKHRMGRPGADFNGNAGNNGNTDKSGNGSVGGGRSGRKGRPGQDFNGSIDNSGNTDSIGDGTTL